MNIGDQPGVMPGFSSCVLICLGEWPDSASPAVQGRREAAATGGRFPKARSA